LKIVLAKQETILYLTVEFKDLIKNVDGCEPHTTCH